MDFGPYQPALSGYKHWPAMLELAGAQVIALDQDDRPSIVANSYGKGKAVLCAYPLESFLALKPSAFEGNENTHMLYQAICQWAGIQPLFRTDNPSVEVSALSGGGHGYAVLANHRGEMCKVRITGRQALKSAVEIRDQDMLQIDIQGTGWTMEISGYGGAVVEWKL